MKKLTVLILTIAFLSISNFAFAGKDSGLYIGGSLGNTSLDVAIAEAEGGFSLDDSDFGYKVFAGYNFGLIPMFDLAVEGSYIDFGEISESIPVVGDVGLGITAFDLFGVAAYNIGPIGIFGKVGQVWWDGDFSTDLGSFSESDNDMAYGIGVRFQFSSIAIRAEYERFDIEGDVDLDFISAGISWTF